MKNLSLLFLFSLFFLFLYLTSLVSVKPVYAGMDALQYKSVDVMKFTKDTLRNQPSDQDIQKIISAMKQTGAGYVAISVPLDPSSDYPGQKPSPRSAQDFTKAWTDAIHTAGLKVMHRGTWNGIEGLYDTPKATGPNRKSPQYWLDKTTNYIKQNPNIFADGDLWAILPERTEGIFSDSSSFLPTSDTRGEYASFFNSLIDQSNSAFSSIGKNVKTGYTSNNYTEIASTWLPQSIFDKAGITVVDHYGSNHTPAEMNDNLTQIFKQTGKKVFLQEWGNYWNNGSVSDAKAMFDTFSKLTDQGILIGLNYWGGWPGANESILNDDYTLNDKGKALASYFGAPVGSPVATPVQSPTSSPSPTPSATPTNSPEPSSTPKASATASPTPSPTASATPTPSVRPRLEAPTPPPTPTMPPLPNFSW